MSAASHWPDDLDRKAMEGMAYADGTRIGRGDLVSVGSRPEAGACEVIGFRPLKGRVVLMSPALGKTEAEPWELSGACAGPTERVE